MATGAVTPSLYQGEAPGKLAVSQDGQFLYMGLARSSAVFRITIDSGTIGARLLLGDDPLQDPVVASGLEVVPGRPEAVVVSTHAVRNGYNRGIAVFDNGIRRPQTIATDTSNGSFNIGFAGDDATLAATSPDGFQTFSVDATGVKVSTASLSHNGQLFEAWSLRASSPTSGYS